MSARQFRTAGIPTLILLAGGALLVLQLSGGGRLRAANPSLPPSDPDMMTRVIATHPPVELVEQRDDHTRVWEIVREVETTHPDGSSTVDTVKSHIHEKGSGLCYKDASGNYVPSVAEWRETPDGFIVDRCAYGLSIGKKIGAGMGYNVEGHELVLRPAYLMVSDGVNQAHLGLLNPDVEGSVVDGKPSVVRFPAAFGPGYDLEYVAEKGGFHQNLIISEPPGLPGGFDAAGTRLYLYTSIDANDYISDPTCWARFGAEPIDLGGGSVLSPASDVDAIVLGGLRGRADGTFCNGPILSFEVSPVYDSAAPHIPDLLAERQLMRDEASAELFLIESIPFGFVEDASLPVVLDYVTVSGSLQGEHTWQTGTTYFVSSNLYLSGSGKLTIQHGVFVKLNCNASIIVQDSLDDEWGKVVAVGTDTDYIRFTAAEDTEWGEDVTGHPGYQQGSYNTALYLAGGSSTQSEIHYCMFRKGGIAVWDFQEIAEPIRHNRISQMGYQGIGIWFYGLSGGAGLHNNLITGCSMVGVALTYATVPAITNNTIDDCDKGINTWNSTCDRITDNILTNDGIGINVQGTCELGLDYNGYWDCETNISGESMGANSMVLEDNPYAEQGEFFLDQSCDLIDAGSRSATYGGLNDCSTSASADRDARDLDIGYHYPHGYFDDTDEDGMPDVWEQKWFGGLSRDGSGDYDGDNLKDLDEYLNGTLPNDSNSDDDDLDDRKEVMRGGGARDWNFPRGPYLHLAWDGDDVEIVVRWTTTSSLEGAIRYRQQTGEWTNPVEEGESRQEHEVSTGPLELDTLYFYEVGWMKKGTTYERQYGTRHFWTPPSSAADFQFVVYGDNRGGNDENFREQHAKVVAGILDQTLNPRFVLHVGDLVHDGGEEGQWNPQFFWPAQALLEIAPLFPTLGNHEYNDDENAANYKAYFTLPDVDPEVPGDAERWYSFDYGDCHFICLDVYNVSDFDDEADDQREWLATDLAGASGQRLFAWFHNPPFSSGPHGSNQQTLDNGRYVRQHLVPIFQDEGVNMVFSGHDHLYERAACTYLGNTIRYVVTGGGGAPLADGIHDYDYPEPPTRPQGQTTVQEALYAQNWHPGQADNSTFQFCLLGITTSSCQILMYRWDGTLKDEWP